MTTYVPKNMSPAQRLEWNGWDETDTGCWVWQGPKSPKGYGIVWYAGDVWRAHRLAYVAWVGPITDGQVVRHLVCDNPPCINPAHLAVGSQADNVRDRDERGRRTPPRGILNGRATLTEAEVFDIKFRLSEGESVSSIARSLGITVSKVSHIKNGVTWVG